MQTFIDDKAKAQKTLDQQTLKFLETFWKVQVGKDLLIRILEFLLKMFSPGVWVYFYSFVEQQQLLDNCLGAVSNDYSMTGLKHTIANPPFSINISNIDWWDRKAVKDTVTRGEDIIKNFERGIDDIIFRDGDMY